MTRVRRSGMSLIELLVVLVLLFSVLLVVSPLLTELLREERGLQQELRVGNGLASLLDTLSRDLEEAAGVTAREEPRAERMTLVVRAHDGTATTYVLARTASVVRARRGDRRLVTGGTFSLVPDQPPGRLGLRLQPASGIPEEILLRAGTRDSPVTVEVLP